MTHSQIAAYLAVLAAVSSAYLAVLAVPSGDHTCTAVTKIPVTMLVNVTVPMTFRSYTWCLRVPPRCSKYTVQLKDRVQLHTEMHNKSVTVCCRGYVEMEGRCVPACPEGADCPFMKCNRTNHCHCTPGYTGLYCNDPCPRGIWGENCKRPCDCPSGYTCHHLTGNCMVDDRPARKSPPTTTTISTTPTTTRPPTTTEATTLETVKTPQFRFPPPPWVEAAGSTTQKKLTTRIIRDDLYTTAKITEASSPKPTTVAVKEHVKTPFIEFSLPQRPTTTLSDNTIPKRMSITTEKNAYLPPVTQGTTNHPTIVPTPGLTTTRKLTLKEILEEYFTKPSTTTFLPPILPEVIKSQTSGTIFVPIPLSTQTVTKTPKISAKQHTATSEVPTLTSESVTTVSDLITTQEPKPTAPVIALATPMTTPKPTSFPPVMTVAAPSTIPAVSITDQSSTLATQALPIPTVVSTTVSRERTSSTVAIPSTVTSPTTMSTRTTPATTDDTVNSVKVPQTTFNNMDAQSKTPSTPTMTLWPKATRQEETIDRLSTITPEFKVIKVIKTNHSLPIFQKFPTTKDQTFTESEVFYHINQSIFSLPVTKEPIIIHQQRPKIKEDRSPIIYISPRMKEDKSDLNSKNEVPHLGISGTTSNLHTSTKYVNKFDENRRDNEISLKEFSSIGGTSDTKTTVTVTTHTTQQSNRSLLHSLFSEPKTSNPYDEEQIPSTPERHPLSSTIPELLTTETAVKATSESNVLSSFDERNDTENIDKNDDSKIFNIITLESTTHLYPIDLLKQLLNAASKPKTTTPPTTLPPKYFEDDFTKEIINKKLKYDDLIVPYSPAEKNKKKHEKNKPSKQMKESKEEKDYTSTTFVKPENDLEVPIPPVKTTPTTGLPQSIKAITQTFTTPTTTKIIEREILEQNPINFNDNTKTTPNVMELGNNVRNKEDGILTTEVNSHTATDSNNIVGSNTIDTLHTPFEEGVKNIIGGEEEDPNYSVINNRMKLVKTETLYGAAGMTGTIPTEPTLNGVFLIVSSTSIVLISLAGMVWVYLRRRRMTRIPVQPCIMAYQLPEPAPTDVQNLEDVFFFPTFTNTYAAKINRELQELRYDHPRNSQPEPLYAELRY